MWRDAKFLLDMLLAARDSRELAASIDKELFETELVHQLAIAKAVELIGEAARRVSEQTRAAHPGIDWVAIVGLRHRIVHDYRNIDLDRLWKIVRDDVPALVAELERIVPPEEEV
jgi:uncharacterized protein with HEPN domain